MSAILITARIATEIKTLSTREQWPDSAISQLTILLVRVLCQLSINLDNGAVGFGSLLPSKSCPPQSKNFRILAHSFMTYVEAIW